MTNDAVTGELDRPETAGSGLSRRQAIAVTTLPLAAGLATLASVGILNAESGKALSAPVAEETLNHFMRFSHLATGHTSLNPDLGARLYSALLGQDREFSAKMGALTALAARISAPDVEALDDALKTQPVLRNALLAVVHAWYSGVVAEGSNATVYAFEEALMYQPARDQVVIPTYAHDGPNYWVKAPPPVDVVPIF